LFYSIPFRIYIRGWNCYCPSVTYSKMFEISEKLESLSSQRCFAENTSHEPVSVFSYYPLGTLIWDIGRG
jgi:hypothetical protein